MYDYVVFLTLQELTSTLMIKMVVVVQPLEQKVKCTPMYHSQSILTAERVLVLLLWFLPALLAYALALCNAGMLQLFCFAGAQNQFSACVKQTSSCKLKGDRSCGLTCEDSATFHTQTVGRQYWIYCQMRFPRFCWSMMNCVSSLPIVHHLQLQLCQHAKEILSHCERCIICRQFPRQLAWTHRKICTARH